MENCRVLEHAIDVVGAKPIKQTPRRIFIHLHQEVKSIISDMKRQEIIEESQSSWVSPAVRVKKKDSSLQFCMDYRKLNAVENCYPLPKMDDIL